MSLKSAIHATIALISVMLVFMMTFPVIAKDAELMNQVFSKFPPEFAKAIGLSTFNLSEVLGFYVFSFSYILLIGSIYAMKFGISVLSEEVRAKTSDFLVVKPVSRNAIVTAKLMSVISNLFFIDIVFISSAFIAANFISDKPFDTGIFLLINISLVLVQLFFVSFGLFLSVVIKKIRTVLPITMGVVFGFFVLHLLNESLEEVKLAYLTPFDYFDVEYIIANAGYKTSFLLLDAVLITVFIGLTYLIYNKNDMPSV
jgi:ABC-2 type transport system permease protein